MLGCILVVVRDYGNLETTRKNNISDMLQKYYKIITKTIDFFYKM